MSHLNNLGPKVIPMEMFEHYKSLPPPSGRHWTISKMFEYWIDEANPDGLRILTLRDLLRQDDHNTAIDSQEDIYRHVDESYKTILYLKDNEALPRAFAGRPKLVNEFAKELLYNFDHHHMVRSAPLLATGAGDECDRLIELLLPRVSQKMAHNLWKYHSCNPNQRPHLSEEKIYYIFDHLLLNHDLPDWLTEKLWQTIHHSALAEGNLLPPVANMTIFSENKLEFCDAQYATLIALIRHLQRIYDQPKLLGDTMKLIDLLETCFPARYIYVDFDDAVRIAPIITDPALTARFLGRHLDALSSESLPKPTRETKHDALCFLYWVHGFVLGTKPEPPMVYDNFLSNVKRLIWKTHELGYLPTY